MRSMPRVLMLVVILAMSLPMVVATPAAAVAPGTDAFWRTWARTDKPVDDRVVTRSWMWGPEAFTEVLTEDYEQSPGGSRQVQYFDKSRMEINDPSGDQTSQWYVSNGLLVYEMITGLLQVGDTAYEPMPIAEVNVAGDLDDPNGPTYRTFVDHLDAPAIANGSVITQSIDRDGTVSDDQSKGSYNVTATAEDEYTHHAIASVFRQFIEAQGPVYENGEMTTGAVVDIYATGRPITEAYWTTVRVDGDERDVLVQCFERRCLTYTPANPAEWQVEMGNVGRHYFEWRYETTEAERILAQRPFAPTDTTWFTPFVYPDAPAHEPAPFPGLTEEEFFAKIERDLREYLRAQYGPHQQVRIDELVTLYYELANGTDKVEYIQPILAASIVALSGTVAEPILNDIRNGAYQWIDFGTIFDPDFSAEVRIHPDTSTREIVFNDRMQFEHFLLFTPIIAHEALHRDVNVSIAEEIFASYVQSMVYAEIMLLMPSISSEDGAIAPRLNNFLMALVNSGRTGASRTVIWTATGDVFPGGMEATSFEGYTRLSYEQLDINLADDSEADTLASQVAELIVDDWIIIPNNATFRDLIEVVDAAGIDPDMLSPEDLVQVACVLELDVPGGC